MNNVSFNYTSAALVSILGAVFAVAITFGLGMTQENTHSILLVAGIVGGAINVGGGIKSAALIHMNVRVPEWLHFTPATLIALVGGVGTLLVSFRVNVSQENIDSLTLLVTLIGGGMVVGGGVKSAALLHAGIHPALKRAPVA